MSGNRYVINDPKFGKVYVIEGRRGLVMTNQAPNPHGQWVKRGNTFTFVSTPNRASRRHVR